MRIFPPKGVSAVLALVGLTSGLVALSTSAFAENAVQKECSEKYQAAKAGGTLNGMTYNQYYKQCAAEAKTAPPAATPAPTAATTAPPTETKPQTAAEKKAEKAEEKAEKKAEKAQEKAEKKAKKDGEPTPTAAAPVAPTAAAPTPTAPAPAATAAKPMPAPTPTAAAPALAATGNAVFPNAISAQFSKETPGKARMHTCLAQYKINKTNNANGGLEWIEKGGGYYSECNKHLKG